METRYSLCPSCDACPEVVIEAESITIGEGDNTARLTTQEWNVLVAAIRGGELTAVPAPEGQRESSSCDCGCGCDCC